MVKIKCHASTNIHGSTCTSLLELENDEYAKMSAEEVEKMALEVAMENVDCWFEIVDESEDEEEGGCP